MINVSYCQPTCPYCFKEDSENSELYNIGNDGDVLEVTCKNCGKKYKVTFYVAYLQKPVSIL